MKGNVKTFKSIKQLVAESLMDIQAGDVRREQFTRFALKYFSELNLSRGTDIKTVKLNLKPWGAIELPEDCVDWCSLGIQCGDMIKTFVKDTFNTALLYEKDENGVNLPNTPCDSTCDLTTLPVSDRSVPFYNYSPFGGGTGRLFGLAVHDNGLGYYTENKNKDSCEIQFRGRIPSTTKIYLQYMSNGINACGETMVHPYYTEYIIAGVHVERCRFGSREEKMMLGDAKDELNRQRLLVMDYVWEWSTEDIMEILNSGYGLYPKG